METFRLKAKGRCNFPLTRLDHILDLPPHDLLMIGDGSGSGNWSIGAGWACVTIERDTDKRFLTWGGYSRGPVLLAELMAYLQALMDYEFVHGHELRQKLRRSYRIVVLTDNDTLVKQHHQIATGANVANVTAPLWAAMNQLVTSKGILITFYHIPRISICLNDVVDQISRTVRETVQDDDKMRAFCVKNYGSDLYQLNPIS